jgi:hypothetical protein
MDVPLLSPLVPDVAQVGRSDERGPGAETGAGSAFTTGFASLLEAHAPGLKPPPSGPTQDTEAQGIGLAAIPLALMFASVTELDALTSVPAQARDGERAALTTDRAGEGDERLSREQVDLLSALAQATVTDPLVTGHLFSLRSGERLPLGSGSVHAVQGPGIDASLASGVSRAERSEGFIPSRVVLEGEAPGLKGHGSGTEAGGTRLTPPGPSHGHSHDLFSLDRAGSGIFPASSERGRLGTGMEADALETGLTRTSSGRPQADLLGGAQGGPCRLGVFGPGEAALATRESASSNGESGDRLPRGMVERASIDPPGHAHEKPGERGEKRDQEPAQSHTGVEPVGWPPAHERAEMAKLAQPEEPRSPLRDLPAKQEQISRSVQVEVQQPDVGRVHLHVRLVEHTVHASLTTEHDALGHFLLAHQGQLEHELKSLGLEMGTFQVLVDQQGRRESGPAWGFGDDQAPSTLSQGQRETGEELEVVSIDRLSTSRPIGAEGASRLSLFA